MFPPPCWEKTRETKAPTSKVTRLCRATWGLKAPQGQCPQSFPSVHCGRPPVTLTSLDLDEVMRRVHIPPVPPLSHISLVNARHFPTPMQASTGKRSIWLRYTHCTVGTQTMFILMCPQSTQTSEAIEVALPFHLGHVYQPQDLGLDPLHLWHAQPPAVPMLQLSILSPVDLQMGDLAVATLLYWLIKEVLFTLEIVTEGNQEQYIWDFHHWVEWEWVERWVVWAMNFRSQNYWNLRYHWTLCVPDCPIQQMLVFISW